MHDQACSIFTLFLRLHLYQTFMKDVGYKVAYLTQSKEAGRGGGGCKQSTGCDLCEVCTEGVGRTARG